MSVFFIHCLLSTAWIEIPKPFQKIKDEASSDENSDGQKGDDEDDAPVGSLKPKRVRFIPVVNLEI